ncbi:flavin reductase family protein [Pseudoramibacter faecis]|uniref:flavin reductase family protein n=1 Tax=Pseudoramibacter faecis TaxID=3108534 RepID=UPI002E76C1C2|nr:flavin reductase [Pseudoramibacter sp. HA2172]
MKRRNIQWQDYAPRIMEALPKGILLTTRAHGKTNTMVIGWGGVGINWARPVFTAYIREHRFTAEQLAAHPEFTINLPVSGPVDPAVIKICGSRSGRDIDKIAAAHLTPVAGEKVAVPAIAELPLTLECKVLYKQLQDMAAYPEDIREAMYPRDVDSFVCAGPNKDAHYTVIAEITAAYILEA